MGGRGQAGVQGVEISSLPPVLTDGATSSGKHGPSIALCLTHSDPRFQDLLRRMNFPEN